MEIRTAQPSERDQVLDLLALWHGDRTFFARYNQNDPRFRDELCLVAAEGGEIVATVQIFDREINLNGQSVPMGGIGSVFCREDRRHRGLASALMRLAIETMRSHGFEVSLLFTDRLTFYAQFGWRAIVRRFTEIRDAALLEVARPIQIEVFDPTRDLPEVIEIHRSYSGRFNVTGVRDEPTWRASMCYAGSQPGRGSEEYFVVCREAGRIVAYARLSGFDWGPALMEYGYDEGAEDSMLGLFQHLGRVAAGRLAPLRTGQAGPRTSSPARANRRARSILTHTAHDPLLEERLKEGGCPPLHLEDDHYMWRVIDPQRLGRRFGMDPQAASRELFRLLEDERSLYWTSDRF